jgi:hypothetical protein
MNTIWAAVIVLSVTSALGAQNAPDPPKFDVASVKPYKDDGVGDRELHNSYGTQGINFQCALPFAIGEAYNFPVGRIVGPDSLTKETLWGTVRHCCQSRGTSVEGPTSVDAPVSPG